MVECLPRDRGAAGSTFTGVTVLWSLRHIYPSLECWFNTEGPVPVQLKDC